MKQTNSSPNVQLIESITDREREILALMAKHYTNKEIAGTLHLALSTIKWYTKQIYGKLTVNNRHEAVKRATELGILGADQPGFKPNNLPSPPTIFVGREEEFEEIVSLLTKDEIRLLTLHGPGGSGKTRLAIQAASKLVELGDTVFPNGVWHVSLASLQNPELIPQFIGSAIGHAYFDTDREPLQQIVDYLQQRNLLLILDNLEHLISVESTRLIAKIIAHAPHIKILVTSRIRLNVQGEQIFPVGGLKIPPSDTSLDMDWEAYSAIQLFVHCARRVQPKFEINEQNLEPTIKICQLVEGMPLGIELASSWLEILSPNEIAAEIIRSLDFMDTNQTGATDRHRSIRAVFDSSWKLLSQEERDAFLHLSVFVGSFSREAAQKVSGATLQALLGLANKSWLGLTKAGRFQLHELMRQFGEEHLRIDAKVWQIAKEKHAAYYADFVAEQSLKMRSPDQISGLIAIDNEFETNIKSAWDWLISQSHWNTVIRKMIQGLCHYVTITKRLNEMIPWLRTARRKFVETEKDNIESLVYAILGTAEAYCEEESHPAAFNDSSQARLKEIWKIVTDYQLAEEMGYWYVMLAGLVHAKNLDLGAIEQLDEAIDQMRKRGDPWVLGMSLIIRANWLIEFNLEEDKLLEALQIFEELGIPYEQSFAAELLANFALQGLGEPTEFKLYIEQSAQFYKELSAIYPKFNYLFYRSIKPGHFFPVGEFEKGFAAYREQHDFFERSRYKGSAWFHSLYWESLLATRYSSYDHARKTRELCLKVAKEFGTQTYIYWNTYELGEVYRVFGNQLKAMDHYTQAYSGFEKVKGILGLGYCHRAFGDLAIQNSQYTEALEEYRKFMNYAVEDNHLWSIAQAHGKLALAHAHLNNLEKSRSELHTALDQMHTWWNQADLKLDTSLVETACLIKQGKLDEAVSLSWFILDHRLSWNATKHQARLFLDEASSHLPAKDIELAKKRGNKLILDEFIKNYIQSDDS